MRTLNIKLLAWLGAISLLLIVGTYFLNKVQVRRNAHYLLELADKAEENEDYMAAVRHVKRYLSFDNQNPDINARFALLMADLVESSESTLDQYHDAYNALEGTLRRFPERDDIRKRLAEFAPKFGRFEIAIEQYEKLLASAPPDAEELKIELGKCYEANDDNDQALELYNEMIQSSPGNLDAYMRRARLFRIKMNEAAQADETVDQMVAANQNVAKAYLKRAQYLQEARLSAGTAVKLQQMTDRLEEDLEKALSLGPDDEDTLIFVGEYWLGTKGPELARPHFEHLRQVAPDDIRARRWLAILDWTAGKHSDAVAQLKAIFDENREEREIQWFLTDYQLRNMETDAARETISQIRSVRDVKKRLPNDLLDLLESRALMNERKFSEAVRLLDNVRPRLARDPAQAIQVDLFMALCYAELGQTDLQLQSYQQAVLLDATNLAARKGLATTLAKLGRIDEAIVELQQIVQRDQDVIALLVELMTRKLAKGGGSAEELEKIKKFIEDYGKGRGEAGTADAAMIQVNILMAQGKFDEAKKLLEQRIAEDPKAVNPWLSLADITLKTAGPEPALKVLDEARTKISDSLQLKLARIEVLARYETSKDPDKAAEQKKFAVEQLKLALAETDGYPEEQQTGFWDKLGTAFLRLGDQASTKDLWQRVADRREGDPQSHLRLFAIMLDSKDETGVQTALDRLRKNFGDGSAEYNYGEAARRIYSSRAGESANNDATLKEAEEFIKRGLEARPQWHVLHTALAEIEAIRGNTPQAIEKYQEGVQLGERGPLHLRNLITLLIKSGRNEEARQAIGVLEEAGHNVDEYFVWQQILDPKRGSGADDGKLADRVASSENAREVVVLGQLLFERRDWEAAENAFLKAVQLAPAAPEGWVALVDLYRATSRPAQAEKLIEEIETKVADDVRPVTLARCYAILDKVDEAEKNFEKALAAQPDDLKVKRQAASFYLVRNNVKSAEKLLDEILSHATKADAEDRTHVEWARRHTARLVSSKGDYKSLMQALGMIDENAHNGVLNYDDLVLKAELLGRRSDLQSKREALELFEQARQVSKKVPPAVTLEMAKLYDRTGDWSKCRETMVQLLQEAPEDAGYQGIYIEMLIRHEELSEAQPRIEKLIETDPNSTVAIEAQARLFVTQEKIDEAVELLERMVPNPTPPNQQGIKRTVAGFMISLARTAKKQEDAKALHAAAERMIRNYVDAMPKDELVLANFLGEYGDLEECLTICQKAIDAGNLRTPVEVALANFRNRRHEITPPQFDRVNGWIKRAAAEIKPPIVAKLFEADMRDIQGKYDDTEAIYRDLLKQEGLRDAEIVTVLNNLAYIVAVRDEKGEEALQMIQKAIDINGPMAELLDTRGVVQIALNKPEEAIQDIEAALVESPDWLKFLHLAVAHLRANRNEAVADAYREAERIGLNEKHIPPLERKFYVEVKQMIDEDKRQARN